MITMLKFYLKNIEIVFCGSLIQINKMDNLEIYFDTTIYVNHIMS